MLETVHKEKLALSWKETASARAKTFKESDDFYLKQVEKDGRTKSKLLSSTDPEMSVR